MTWCALVELASWRNFRLVAWRWGARRLWLYRGWRAMTPQRKVLWRGKLVYWSLGPLELHIDRRGDALDVLADMTGRTREDLEQRLAAREVKT